MLCRLGTERQLSDASIHVLHVTRGKRQRLISYELAHDRTQAPSSSRRP